VTGWEGWILVFAGFAGFGQGLLAGGVSALRSQIDETKGGVAHAIWTWNSPCNLRLREACVVVAMFLRGASMAVGAAAADGSALRALRASRASRASRA
jgi:hypothetical protein